jgi:hypothetical protein
MLSVKRLRLKSIETSIPQRGEHLTNAMIRDAPAGKSCLYRATAFLAVPRELCSTTLHRTGMIATGYGDTRSLFVL